jgi:hypothetical protein
MVNDTKDLKRFFFVSFIDVAEVNGHKVILLIFFIPYAQSEFIISNGNSK